MFKSDNISCKSWSYFLSLFSHREEYFIKRSSLLIFNLFSHHFTIFQYDVLHRKDYASWCWLAGTRLSNAKLHLLPDTRDTASSDPQSRVVHDVVSTWRRKIKWSDRNPFSRPLCHLTSAGDVPYIRILPSYFIFYAMTHWLRSAGKTRWSDGRKKRRKNERWCDQSWSARARRLTPATL